ncbi:hypothetical protein [Cellulomonas sp. S1-8]|uniref:hypothetical protein n=1 Tax=Cellulomonas sp. S1-8 TaxID=2904790 RepID=UPI002243268D|nr:hypothetical protein [Cellulomonas sp. S1-8]UZN03906.1 hypothetical protein OKX07_02895 [Cellulomonas sp. S1-8]
MDDVVDELYGGTLDDFVARRDAAVRAARAAKDRDLAGRIASLRKPTLAAWAVNLLVRDDPTLGGTLRDLGEGMRDAERSLDGPALRELGKQRRALVSGLVARARRLAVDAGQRVSTAAAQEVERTLTAALADPRVADAVAAGTLTHGTEHVGFGAADTTVARGPDDGAGDAPQGGPAVDPASTGTAGRGGHASADDAGAGSGASTTRKRSASGTTASSRSGPRSTAVDTGTSDTTAKARGTSDAARAERAEAARLREQEKREREQEKLRRRHEQAVAAREEADAELERLRTRHEDAATAERDAVTALEDAETASSDAYAAEEELVRALADVRRRLADARAALPRADETLVAAKSRAREREKAVRAAVRELDRATAAAERARDLERRAADDLT